MKALSSGRLGFLGGAYQQSFLRLANDARKVKEPLGVASGDSGSITFCPPPLPTPVLPLPPLPFLVVLFGGRYAFDNKPREPGIVPAPGRGPG